MSIPYNDNLSWASFTGSSNWHIGPSEPTLPPLIDRGNPRIRVNEYFVQCIKKTFVPGRGVQFIRDTARLVLKVPIRSIWTPIVLPKNWRELERSKINAKLTGYSFVQLISVPVKFLVALVALATSAISWKKAHCLLDKSEGWTAHLDGRASQLEALKEVGGKKATDRNEYDQYKKWLYSIDPKLCVK